MGRRKTGREKRIKRKNIMMYTARSSKTKATCVLTWLMSVSGPGICIYLCNQEIREHTRIQKAHHGVWPRVDNTYLL